MSAFGTSRLSLRRSGTAAFRQGLKETGFVEGG